MRNLNVVILGLIILVLVGCSGDKNSPYSMEECLYLDGTDERCESDTLDEAVYEYLTNMSQDNNLIIDLNDYIILVHFHSHEDFYEIVLSYRLDSKINKANIELSEEIFDLLVESFSEFNLGDDYTISFQMRYPYEYISYEYCSGETCDEEYYAKYTFISYELDMIQLLNNIDSRFGLNTLYSDDEYDRIIISLEGKNTEVRLVRNDTKNTSYFLLFDPDELTDETSSDIKDFIYNKISIIEEYQ